MRRESRRYGFAPPVRSGRPVTGVVLVVSAIVGYALLVSGFIVPSEALSESDVRRKSSLNEVAAANLRPVGWWRERYDLSWDEQDAVYTPLSLSTDSWDHYTLAYGLDGAVAMFRATGDTKYLDQALRYTSNMVSTAKVSSSLGPNAFHDSYLGWISRRPDVAGREVPLFESYVWRYVCSLLLAIKRTPSVFSNPVYRNQYEDLLRFTEVNIFDKWFYRGVRSYIYRDLTHMAAHWAFIAMDLSYLTTDPVRVQNARIVMNYIDTLLRGQIRTNPVAPSAYFWSDVWGQSSRPGQDVAHGNNMIAYLVEAHDLGQGGWTDADMTKFVNLFDTVVWPANGKYAGFVDGSGAGNGWFSDGFIKLGRYDPNLQARIEGITVGRGLQLFGNGALNARLLGGPR